ncbi:MAG: TIGR02444 family protein [Pseudomonadales bacterium]
MPSLDLESPLWRFALDFYAAEGVAENLLALQNDSQCQINQLLFALWAATQKMRIEHPLDSKVTHWQNQVTAPLRQLRFAVRQVKLAQPELAALYKKLLEAELAVEQVEIAQLYRARFELSGRGDDLSCEQLMLANINWAASELCMPEAHRLQLLRTQALEFLQQDGQNTELYNDLSDY